MNEIQAIQSKIYEIRGQRVMLDFDLAHAYGIETSQLKRQVRRNIERFEGDDFMFEVAHEEILRCQIVTSSWGGSRYGAFAFTELGVALSSVPSHGARHAVTFPYYQCLSKIMYLVQQVPFLSFYRIYD